MKKRTVVKYIEKALKEHPEIKPVEGTVYSSEGKKKCACAIGLALIGLCGLETVKKTYRLNRDMGDLYDLFEENFSINPTKVYRINDSVINKEGIDGVLDRLRGAGL
jgi:hypothetical protein